MDLTLGRKGDYAMRAVLDLACHYGHGRRKAREIAEAMDIPARYLPQILALLVRRRLLVAVAGREGGYELARDPWDITLMEVLEVAQGPMAADDCVLRGDSREAGAIERERACILHGPWIRAQRGLVEQLRKTTFRELADAHGVPARPMRASPAAPREGV